MKFKLYYLFFILSAAGCNGQVKFGIEYLKPEQLIEMPNVSRRIDHLAINLKDQIVYVAALGNNTVEVVDLQKGAIIHSIKGHNEPQGITYIPATNEIVVANGGNGNCVFYNATTYAVIATLHPGKDADNIRYNPLTGKIFIGYGEGGIAVIDATSHEHTGDIKLPAHPEGFQIDPRNNLLFVNLPDANSIAVINLNNLKVTNTWKTNDLRDNFPMAIDTTNNLVIIGYRHPSVLVMYDNNTGKEISRTNMVGDVDDVFYDKLKQEIFASGGDGSINIFKIGIRNDLKKVANIPTRPGARTSLLIPSLQTYIIAERAKGNEPAALVVYKINNLKK